MAGSPAQKKAKGKSAGAKKELLGSIRKLEPSSPARATEVEMSSSGARLEIAAMRLKASRAKQKVLQVPDQDMAMAVEAMKTVGISGTVKNMTGTKRRYIKVK
jgi:hypothetical protein